MVEFDGMTLRATPFCKERHTVLLRVGAIFGSEGRGMFANVVLFTIPGPAQAPLAVRDDWAVSGGAIASFSAISP
jgi:hypothetical protein